MASTYEQILGLILQGTGDNNNSWGTVHDNSGFKPIARAIAGVATHADTGGTLDLSGSPPPAGLRQDVDHIQIFTGALVSDLTVVVPALSKTWAFINRTSGSFSLLVKTSGMATPVQVPQGSIRRLLGDGTSVYREDQEEVGALRISAKLSQYPGELLCNGASLLRSQYPDLFAAIGTTYGAADGLHFNIPDYVTNNRFLRAAGGSIATGTTQASQNKAHSHTVTGAPSVGTLSTDSQGSHSHTANTSESPHTHGLTQTVIINGTGGGIGGGGSFGLPLGSGITAATTGLTVSITTGGAHTHNVTGAPGIGSLATATDGSSEARPENMAALICIRY